MADEQFKLDNLFALAKSQGLKGKTNYELISNTNFNSSVIDQVDGRIILRHFCSVQRDEGTISFLKLRGQEGVSVQVTQGQAIVQNDPYTGDTLVTPKGDVPVKVRPVLETTLGGETVQVVGEEKEVGIDIQNIPFDEQRFEYAGGGSCAARWELTGQYDFGLEVRAFMPANVIPLSKARRQINWQHALYFARDAQVGFMRLHYNPALQSQTNLRSHTPEDEISPNNFFPADGQNDLYFVLEMLDMGLSCFNKKPMTQIYQNAEWPPFSTVLSIEEPVEFYNTENPNQLMLTIHKNDMRIYDYSSINVEHLDYGIDEAGLLKSRWRITNQSPDQALVRWFALGNFQRDGRFSDQGNRMLGPAKSGFDSFEVNFVAQLQKSSLPQFITMTVVSLSDPIVAGTERLDFMYPQIEA